MQTHADRISIQVGCAQRVIRTSGFVRHRDGFSFVVESELDAFHAAYCYQGNRVAVKPTSSGPGWSVTVFAPQ